MQVMFHGTRSKVRDYTVYIFNVTAVNLLLLLWFGTGDSDMVAILFFYICLAKLITNI